jgi:hypothetical protein
MSIIFSEAKCQYITEKKLFGLCDDPPPPQKQAYIDEENGAQWIAVVVNENRQRVTFTAIDHCIEIRSRNGKMAKRCDGVLTYDSTIAFVELKEINKKGNEWVKDAEEQLRSTIGYFGNMEEIDNYEIKKAYIANSKKPRFKNSQTVRMEQFLLDTGYVLRIVNRIILD